MQARVAAVVSAGSQGAMMLIFGRALMTAMSSWVRRVSPRVEYVASAAADADDLHGQILVAAIHPDHLERAIDREGGDGVSERNASTQRQAGGNADHYLLSDVDIG